MEMRSHLALEPVAKPRSLTTRLLLASSLVKSAQYHLYTLWLFSCTDIRPVVITSLVFGALNAAIAPVYGMGPALSFLDLLRALPMMLLTTWGGLLLTNLHNQRHLDSINEDKLNKPFRPIPAGRITIHQTNILLCCIYPINISMALAVGGIIPHLVLVVACIWYNEFGGASGLFLKNIHNGIGIASFLAGSLEVATGHSIFASHGQAAVWLAILVAVISTTICLQDFRDMEGDGAIGRRTVPLVIGDWPARLAMVVALAMGTGISCKFWQVSWYQGALPSIVAAILLFKLLRNRTREADGRTFKLWPAWMLCLFLLPYLKHRGSF